MKSPHGFTWGIGSIPQAGVLVHMIDGYENHGAPWVPSGLKTGVDADMSTSVIYKGQHVEGESIPLFGLGIGLILRPTRARVVRCGNANDAGGHCHELCKHPDTDLASREFPGDGCVGQSWPPSNIGVFLQRVTKFQHSAQRVFYNEIILDGVAWGKDPALTEAIFVTKGSSTSILKDARDMNRRFCQAFGLDLAEHPLIILDTKNWESPFSPDRPA